MSLAARVEQLEQEVASLKAALAAVPAPPRATPPKMHSDAELRHQVAALIEDWKSYSEIAAATGRSRNMIRSLCHGAGARPREEDQPRGGWPRPHIGTLVDPRAPRASATVTCPGCGISLHRSRGAPLHVQACPSSGELWVELAIENGWNMQEIASICGRSTERVQAIADGAPMSARERKELLALATSLRGDVGGRKASE